MPKHRTSSAKMAAKIADMMCCNNLSINIGLDDSSGGGADPAGHDQAS